MSVRSQASRSHHPFLHAASYRITTANRIRPQSPLSLLALVKMVQLSTLSSGSHVAAELPPGSSTWSRLRDPSLFADGLHRIRTAAIVSTVDFPLPIALKLTCVSPNTDGVPRKLNET